MKKLFTLVAAMMFVLATSSGSPPEVTAQDDPVCQMMDAARNAACLDAEEKWERLRAGEIERDEYDEAVDRCLAMEEAMETCEEVE